VESLRARRSQYLIDIDRSSGSGREVPVDLSQPPLAQAVE
jgi:hypothetical protein